jgi:glutaredoxin
VDNAAFPADLVPPQITLVTAPGCHFCQDAREALDEIARDFPFEVHEVDLRSPTGTALAQRHRAAMSPLVLLDGRFVSAGRLPRKKLRMLLAQRPTRAAVPQ